MGGVNLVEESRNILAANSELVSGQLRSCKDEAFFDSQRLLARITDIGKSEEVLAICIGIPTESNQVTFLIKCVLEFNLHSEIVCLILSKLLLYF